jgi:GAF domain-containing protein
MVRVSSPHRPEAGRTPGGSRSIAGYAALTGTVVVVEDAQHDRRFDLPPPPAWRDPIVSAIAAPVHGPAGVCGVLIVAGMSQCRFSSASSHFMQSMANVIGMALLLG